MIPIGLSDMSATTNSGKHDVSGGVLRGRVTARPRTSRTPDRCLKAAASSPLLNQEGMGLVLISHSLRNDLDQPDPFDRLVASERPTTSIYSRAVSQFISRSDAAGVGRVKRPTAQVNGCEQSRRHPGKRSIRMQVFRPKEISAPQQARRGAAWAAGRQAARRRRSRCRMHPPRRSCECR